MSTMHDDIAAAMTDLWVFAADSGTYTPPVGDPVSCRIRLDKQATQEPDGLDMKVVGEEIRAKALLSELGQIPVAKTQNQSGGVFTVGSASYEVTEITDKDNHFVECAVREIS